MLIRYLACKFVLRLFDACIGCGILGSLENIIRVCRYSNIIIAAHSERKIIRAINEFANKRLKERKRKE